MSQEKDRRNNRSYGDQEQERDISTGPRDEQDLRLAQCLEFFDFSTPLPEKGHGIFRLFYNNCNGLAINNTIGVYLQQKKDKVKYNYITDINAPTKVDSLLRQMKIWDVDIVNLAEVCIAWEKQVPRQVVQQITKHYDRTGCWTVASSKIDLGGFLKPGGAGILSMGNVNGKISDRGADPWHMGRWAFNLFSGPTQGKQLLVITGYRTGARTSTPGVKTAWAQQQTILLQQDRIEKPHEAFLVDLAKWLSTYKTERMEVILLLDANEQWGERSEITKFANRFQLKNLNEEGQLSATHPNLANPERSTTIDYCLCSATVLQNVRYVASTPFDLDTLGDHRGMVIDIHIPSILGDTSQIEEIKSRKLVLSCPKAVDKYLTFVEEKFQKQNIISRCTKLLKRVLVGETDHASIARHYEALDKEVLGICTKAEQKCKPKWAGPFEWSPKLTNAIQVLRYWRYRLKNLEETEYIKVLGNQLNIKYTKLSKPVIQIMVNDSRNKLTEIQQNSRKYRQDHLEEIASHYAEMNNLSKQQALIELLSHEEARTDFKTLRQRLKPFQKSGLKTLWESRDDNGEYSKDPVHKKIYTEAKEIHAKLLTRNAEHLSQASGTPFARGWLCNRLKWDGTGPLADEILTGNILNERRFRESMQLYLESLQMNNLTRMNVIRPTLSLDEYKLFWKKKRETTVTSPYGLHVGHYKAAINKLQILNVHRILLLIPFTTGIVPSRWRRTVQTMIEKEPGAPWIHRLRIIELFDAQANAGFQIFVGRKMMHYAVKQNLLQAESFGSTPGKMATSALIQKLVSIDQLRIERRAGGIFDCDASGCYDRILPPLASVHLQALGLHRSIGTFLGRLMYQAQRHVKTNHGVSEANIRTRKKRVLHGIGQGNGGGPAMWIAHLTVMFHALSSVCVGFALQCVQSIQSMCTVGTGYVDDVTLGLSVPRDQPQTEHMVYKHIKRMSQLWENMLYITGGRLELSKCFWIPISWKWTAGRPRLVLKKVLRRNLTLRESESRDLIRIPRKTGKETEKRLGVWSSCDGRWNKEVNQWLAYSRDFSQRLRGNNLSRRTGDLAYHSVWISKFRYSASVIGYSSNQLSVIQSAIIGACLSVAGYNRKFPRAVVYGPTRHGGMGWENIVGLALYEKLKILIGSIRLHDNLGKMIQIQLTWLQVFAGCSIPILQSTLALHYLPVSWLTNIHTQLVEHDIQVELTSGWLPSIQRNSDKVLMDIVHAQIPRWAWEGINRCRLFLQVNTITDIATVDGTYIPTKIRKVRGKIRDNNIDFPIQTRPAIEDREQWEFLINLLSIEGVLHTPLGEWIRLPDQHFPYLINGDRTVVYKKIQHEWGIFGRQSTSSKRFIKLKLSVDTVPMGASPVSVIESSKYLLVTSPIQFNGQDRGNTINMYDKRKGLMERNVLGNYRIDENQLQALQNQWIYDDCHLICATDGGLKEGVGTSSYAIFFPENHIPIVSGRAGEWQPRENASSTRQELLGQLGIEYWLTRLETKWGRPRKGLQITLITDSQASIDIMANIPNITGIKDTLKPEMDVALELYQQRAAHPWILWNNCKVESHIDEEDAPDLFNWGCNKYVDEEATKARTEFSIQSLQQRADFLFPGAKAGCKIDGRVVNNGLYERLKYHVNGHKLQTYLMEKYHWTKTSYSCVDWKAHSKALKCMPQGQKVTLIKYIHGWLATKRRRHREGYSPTGNCALCHQPENGLHLFTCTNKQITEIRDIAWKKLLADVSYGTEASFQAVFQEGMQTIMGGQIPTNGTKAEWPNELREAYDAQTEIGWDQILYGRIGQQWDGLAQYYPTVHSIAREGVWAQRAIKLNWQFGLDCWKVRNQLVHGTIGGISTLERERIEAIIRLLFEKLMPVLPQRYREYLNQTDEEVLRLPYQSQVAWIGQVQFLLPDQYKEVLLMEQGLSRDTTEFDMIRLPHLRGNIL